MRYGVAPADYQTQFAKLVPSIPQPGSKEQRTVYRMEGSADAGFFYVAYPRKGNEAAPVCTRLAPGCLKVVTSEATDYVFVGDAPFDFNQEGVVFSGKAGAVRVFRDHVVFCMNSGTGNVGYKGQVFSGSGPFERSVPSDKLVAGAVDLGGQPKNIRSVDIGQGITVRGEDPFKATLDGNVIRIHTEGRARHFIVEPFPDWLKNYRCHFWETPMCNIYEFDQSKLIRDGCTRCMIDCYRDASVLQFIAISASDAYHHLRQGRVGAAARSLLDRRNLTSLRAVWEARVWIRQFQPARPSQGPRLRH